MSKLYFRQTSNCDRSWGYNFIKWNTKISTDLSEHGIDKTGGGDWDYTHNGNKNTFKLELVYE